jgi:protein-S-isoprenylcysteine O-methyltransferase Ste14
MTRFVFAVVAAVYLVAAIPLEERTLRRTSPDRFRRYASRVRWRLVPGVY